MAKIHLNNEQYQSNSHQILIPEDDFLEDDQMQQFRRNTLPLMSAGYGRLSAEKNIMINILAMGFDQDYANAILKSMSDEDFETLDENVILNKVISAILILDNYQNEDSLQQRQHRQELRDMMGTINPNLMSYLGLKSNRQSQQLLQITCGICMESIYDDRYPILDCGHNFCLSCMKAYLIDRIENGQVDQMICPQQECNFQLSDDYINQIVEPDVMTKMKKFRKIKQLQLDPDIIWCPRIGCEETVKRNGKKKLKCKCGQQICRKCGRERHDGQTCNDQIDKDFKKAIKNLKIQKCQKCKSPIQKNDGCNHMTCKTCKYEFCWLCRAKYSYRHYSNYNIFGCPGMQFTQRDPFKYPNLYRFIAILLILILGPPLFILALVLGFIILVIGLPVIFYMNYVPYHQFEEYSCCRKTFIIIFFIIVCPLLSPICFLLVILGIGVAIIVGIPYCIYLFIDWLRYG
ncbi:unnamed protein product [Paramecium primaurelia]|uniref:RBR-type E3 ubiquitin transferase n=1 Tax=Paramecium primaurelia TaxID=5886 RepID=A0A8S1JX29_PARPR|nr:unnamed protein product [Paramecium primaurelia]